VLWFGPQVVNLFGGVVKQHWMLASGAVLEIGLVIWLLVRTRRSRKTAAPLSENGGEKRSL